jgi:hypothetical protein
MVKKEQLSLRLIRKRKINNFKNLGCAGVCGMRHNVAFRDLKRTLSPIVPPLSEVYTHALILLLRWHRHLPPLANLGTFPKNTFDAT